MDQKNKTVAEPSSQHILEIPGQTGESLRVLKLDWDSSMLGETCARLEDWPPIAASGMPDYSSLPKELNKRGLTYVTTRLDQLDWRRIHALEACGFRLVDAILDFKLKLATGAVGPSTARIRLATPDDAQVAGDLSVRTFTHSRFHNDPILSRACVDKVHFEWAKNSCLGQAAQAVFVAEGDGHLAGFITCQTANGKARIGLIGIDTRNSGQGLGQSLVGRACAWFADKGFAEVWVQTQTDNLAAMHLYLKTGFLPVAAKVTLRWSPREPR